MLSKRPHSARVARPIADKGYCPTKQLYYHGFKLHLVGIDRLGAMPFPERMPFREDGVHDLTVLRRKTERL